MKVLIDTHIAIWAVSKDPRLPQKARDILENTDNEIYYSTASVWETTIKHLLHPANVLVSGRRLATGCEQDGYICLPIMNQHVVEIETLKLAENAPRHNDPFDRLLLAQAKTEGMHFLTHDSLIPFYNESFIISV